MQPVAGCLDVAQQLRTLLGGLRRVREPAVADLQVGDRTVVRIGALLLECGELLVAVLVEPDDSVDMGDTIVVIE